jgi:glycosyltransferase involved in cell wall biosynthesis
VNCLFLSRNYPSAPFPLLGLWIEGQARRLTRTCSVRVVSPVPYCPPLPNRFSITRFRRVGKRHVEHGISVDSPRFVTGPGMSLHNYEGQTYFHGIRRTVDRIRTEFPFEIIHSHFGYPDGYAAVRLGQRYGVPVIITEHAFWHPWMDDFPRVREKAVWASQNAAFHTAVSQPVIDSIADFAGYSSRLKVVPVGFDPEVFCPPSDDSLRAGNRIVYVGRLHRTKGVDVLLHAFKELLGRVPSARLVLIGGHLGIRDYLKQELEMRRLAADLGILANIEFKGELPPVQVAAELKSSALLVLPSRRESFGAVVVEALACGTPVVATRCGGPETTVTSDVGLLVESDDATALSDAMAQVLSTRSAYDSNQLSVYARERFSWQVIADQTLALYKQALENQS